MKKLIKPALLNWPTTIEDWSPSLREIERLRLVAAFKDYALLKTLPRLKALWCFGVDTEALSQIADCSLLEELHLDYRLRTGSLRVLQNLSLLRVLTINTCSEIRSLTEVSELNSLEGLSIENFKNVHTIDELSGLRQLTQLGIDGSMWTRMKIESLQPLASLDRLEYLSLTNTKVTDESLWPLGGLSRLRHLDIANFYPTSEFAWLSAQLPNTECAWLKPFINTHIKCPKCGNPRVMLSGKGKPMLCPNCNATRLARHVEEFRRSAEDARRSQTPNHPKV
jgi:Leucine-rich repeat (LRR) protein